MALAPIALATTIDITPPVASLLQGDEHLLTATVADASGQPLEGVRVDFQVSGMHNLVGFDWTDTAGAAQLELRRPAFRQRYDRRFSRFAHRHRHGQLDCERSDDRTSRRPAMPANSKQGPLSW